MSFDDSTSVPDRRSTRKVLAVVGLLVLALIAIALWVWEEGADRRAIERLSPGERAALFERTVANIETLCGPAAERGAARLCREQAKFLLTFPECDPACRRRVQAILEPATR